jgi:hypothetical protein
MIWESVKQSDESEIKVTAFGEGRDSNMAETLLWCAIDNKI